MNRGRAVVVAAVLAVMVMLTTMPGAFWPLQPWRSASIDVARMKPVYGQAGPASDGSLFVTGSHRGTALQITGNLDIDASELSILRYSARDFPATLELTLSWRRAHDPLEMHIATLPVPGFGLRTFDLSDLAEWRGTVIEMGLGQFPVPHHASEDSGFQQFHMDRLRVESPSLVNSAGLFLDTLIEARPWSHRSINSLGRELHASAGHATALTLMLGLSAFAFVWLGWCRWRSEHGLNVLAPVAVAAALCWVVLDFGWQSRLSAQNRLTRAADAGGIHSDESLLLHAERLRQWLAKNRPDAKVLVLSTMPYITHRLVYHLLPVDAAAGVGVLSPGGARPNSGTVLAVYTPLQMTRTGVEMRWPDIAIANLRALAQLGSLRIYEYRDLAGP